MTPKERIAELRQLVSLNLGPECSECQGRCRTCPVSAMLAHLDALEKIEGEREWGTLNRNLKDTVYERRSEAVARDLVATYPENLKLVSRRKAGPWEEEP